MDVRSHTRRAAIAAAIRRHEHDQRRPEPSPAPWPIAEHNRFIELYRREQDRHQAGKRETAS